MQESHSLLAHAPAEKEEGEGGGQTGVVTCMYTE